MIAHRLLALPPACQMRKMVNGVDIGNQQGVGNGGRRCTETVATMFNLAYKVGALAKQGADARTIMYSFVAMLNGVGAITSQLEDPIWIGNWLTKNSSGSITMQTRQWPGFFDVLDVVARGHGAVLEVQDYQQLRLSDGTKPYSWTDPPNEGHVVALCGIDVPAQVVYVNDPLLAPARQPSPYSWKSFQNARLSWMGEVVGPSLPVLEEHMSSDPNFTIDDANAVATCKSNGFKVEGNFYHQLFGMLSHPEAFTAWYGLPQENKHSDVDGWDRQRFDNVVAWCKPDNSQCKLMPLMAWNTLQQMVSDLAAQKALVQQLQSQPPPAVTKPLMPGAAEAIAAIQALEVAFNAIKAGVS